MKFVSQRHSDLFKTELSLMSLRISFASLMLGFLLVSSFIQEKTFAASLTFVGGFSGTPTISKDKPESSGSAGLVNAGLQTELSNGTILLNNFSIFSSTDGDANGFFATNTTSARFDGIRSFNIEGSPYKITLEANYSASLFTEDRNDAAIFDFAKLAVVRLRDDGSPEPIENLPTISLGRQTVSGNNRSEAFSGFRTVQFNLQPGFYALAPP